jgi:hypothetical protein
MWAWYERKAELLLTFKYYYVRGILSRFRLPSAEKPALALALAKRGKRGAGDGM